MKMIKIYPYDSQRDIMGKRKFTAMLSMVAIIISLVALFVYPGPSWGIDFQGGTEMIVHFNDDVTDQEVRDAAQSIGLTDAMVQRFGDEDERRFLVQTRDVSVVDQPVVESIRAELSQLEGFDYANWSDEQPDRMDLRFEELQDLEEIEAAIAAAGLQRITVEAVGQAQEARYLVRFPDLQNIIRTGFGDFFGDKFSESGGLERLETVGPRAGDQLRTDGMVAMFFALLAILAYIWFRFDTRYSPGAVAALAHDITIALGLFALLQIEISLPIVAALLTIIGYSLNDTIVVFDRIRENMESAGTRTVEDVTNEAINQTMSRTLITSITTLLAVGSIAVFASGLIQDFAVALAIGVVVGTYSSIFVASPVMLKMDAFLKSRKKAQDLLEAAENPEGL